jgi:bifunctional DNA-binding transcriptional regulator/antitoxin component of YhaV-PrlF toxin-antitoxin module
MIRQLSKRKTITIPSETLNRVGSKPGDLFEVADDGSRIILTPKVVGDRLTEEEWKKLEGLVRERGKRYQSGARAKEHLKRIVK